MVNDRLVPSKPLRCAAGGLLGLLILSVGLAGCNGETSTDTGPSPANTSTSARTAREATDSDAVEAPAPRVESRWEICFIGDAKVGYSHTQAETVVEEGELRVRIRSEQQLKLLRDGEVTDQHLVLESVELPDGTLQRFSSRMTGGNGRIESEGQRLGEQLEVGLKTQGADRKQRIAWDRSWGGFFAVEQSLARQPLEPGEQRKLRMLLPLLNLVGDVQLQAGDYEHTELPVGHQELLRIDSHIDLPGARLELVYWMDRDGGLHKSWDPQIDLYCYRTTKDVALAKFDGKFDLNLALRIRVDQPLPEAHRTRRIRYRATLKRGDPAEVFPNGQSQGVQSVDPHTAEIEVRAVRPEDPAEIEAAPRPPVAADSAPNGLIQSDNARIQTMAESVAPGEDDPWTVAQALEQYVRQAIRKKDFSQSFATAAEVAESLQGDCTEHAVLLAALARARGLPTRVASGLVYYRQAFAYHMWNEVWIKDRWVPLDATLGQSGIGAAHLKLAESDLSGVSPLGALLPVVQVLGQLDLEIVDVE